MASSRSANHVGGIACRWWRTCYGGPVYQHSQDSISRRGGTAPVTAYSPSTRAFSGRGFDFSRSHLRRWGNLDVHGHQRGITHASQTGRRRSERIGVEGWSYGGILTDYMIASDQLRPPRFPVPVCQRAGDLRRGHVRARDVSTGYSGKTSTLEKTRYIVPAPDRDHGAHTFPVRGKRRQRACVARNRCTRCQNRGIPTN